jgi:hypothetical protein
MGEKCYKIASNAFAGLNCVKLKIKKKVRNTSPSYLLNCSYVLQTLFNFNRSLTKMLGKKQATFPSLAELCWGQSGSWPEAEPQPDREDHLPLPEFF